MAETGLNLLHEMLVSFQNSQYVTQFYATYYTQIMQEVFAVMTGAGPHTQHFVFHGGLLRRQDKRSLFLSVYHALTQDPHGISLLLVDIAQQPLVCIEWCMCQVMTKVAQT